MHFDRKARVFEFQARLNGEKSTAEPYTLVLIPRALYPRGFSVELQGGQGWSYDGDAQILSISAEAPSAGELELRVEPKPG
jgi:hypothetical protein